VTPAILAPWRKEVSSMSRRFSCALALVAAVCVVALTGCGKSQSGAPFSNLRPTIEISDSPITGDSTFYSVRINWFASDPDGQARVFPPIRSWKHARDAWLAPSVSARPAVAGVTTDLRTACRPDPGRSQHER